MGTNRASGGVKGVTGLVIAVWAVWVGSNRAEDVDKAEKAAEPPTVERLIADLASADGKVRAAATGEIFARGKGVLPELKKAGAKQIAPFGGTVDGARRLDAVYSLLEGLPPNLLGARSGYKTDGFGLHVVKGTTAEDVARLGKNYGFTLDGTFRADGRPNCYVKLAPGKTLDEVLRRVLAEVPAVATTNLNYFEQ